jgi:hypothetical protein
MDRIREPAAIAVDHLLAYGIVTAGELFEMPISIVRISGRSRVLKISGFGRPMIFKEYAPRLNGPEGLGQREVDFYEFLSRSSAEQSPWAITSRLIHSDPESGRLIVEALQPGETAHMRLRRANLSDALADRFGSTLYQFHSGAYFDASAFDKEVVRPFYMSFGRGINRVRARRASATEVLQLIEDDPEILAMSKFANDAWSATTVVHGDLRLSNLFVLEPNEEVKFLDWETVGRGDICCDIGSILGSISYNSVAGEKTLLRDLQWVKRLSTRFLSRYQVSQSAADFANKTWTFAALAFLQFAFEDAQLGIVPLRIDALKAHVLSLRDVGALGDG